MDELVKYAIQLGLSVALVLFFVWRDFMREGVAQTEKVAAREREDKEKAGLISRLEKVEDGVRGELMQISKTSVAALENCASALDRCTDVMRRLEQFIDRKLA